MVTSSANVLSSIDALLTFAGPTNIGRPSVMPVHNMAGDEDFDDLDEEDFDDEDDDDFDEEEIEEVDEDVEEDDFDLDEDLSDPAFDDDDDDDDEEFFEDDGF
jgi:hypothetical protein